MPIDEGAMRDAWKALGEAAGRVSAAKLTFQAEAAEGSVVLDYALDARGMEGRAAVAVAVLADSDGYAVAAHADVRDKDQSVLFTAPSIRTKAADATDGDNVIYNSAEAKVTDTVTYRNVRPGVEHTLKGELMDKTAGRPLMVGDKPVEATAKFTPVSPNGEAQVEFAFDASGLVGHELVAYERLYRDMETEGGASEPVLVAQHTDLDDADQTVTVTGVAPGGDYPKTGVPGDPLAQAVLATLAVAAVAAGCALWPRRRARG